MRLNMTIMNDWLADAGFCILSARTSKFYSFNISNFKVIDERTVTELASGASPLDVRSTLFVCNDANLERVRHELLRSVQLVNVICIGAVTAHNRKSLAEYICIDEGTDLVDLINALSSMFAWYNDWSDRLDAALKNITELHHIGELGVEVFHNDCCLLDKPQRMLFHACPEGEQRFSETYAQSENTYFPKEQVDAFLNSTEYKDASKSKVPVITPNEGFLPYQTLQFTLFDDDMVIGTVTVDETCRSFRQSDYSLIYYFGIRLKNVLLAQSSLYTLADSEELIEMIRMLVLDQAVFDDRMGLVLKSAGWRVNDEYKCTLVRYAKNMQERYSLSQTALYFYSMFDQMCACRLDSENLLMVFNLTRSEHGGERIISKIDECMKRSNGVCAVSGSFDDFAQLAVYYRQAVLTLVVGSEKDPDRNMFSFSHRVLDVILHEATEQLPAEALLTRKLKNFIVSSRSKRGDLLETLKVYLRSGCNATKAMNKLNIQRTAFYRRLNAIEKTYGIDLGSYRSRLYLLIALELVESADL